MHYGSIAIVQKNRKMDKYNIEKLNNPVDEVFSEDNEVEEQAVPRYGYLKAILSGLVSSLIVGVLLAMIAMSTKSEYILALIIGALIVGFAIRYFIPSHKIGGAIIGFFLCPFTYVVYQAIMLFNGYAYEKDAEDTFWMELGLSALYGIYIGYRKNDDDE